MIPSLSDYAIRDSALYLQLWEQCIFAAAPGLGNTGGKIWDFTTYGFQIPANYNVDRWNPGSTNTGLDAVTGSMPSFGFIAGTNGSCHYSNFACDLNTFAASIWVNNAGQASTTCVFSIGNTGTDFRLLNTAAGTFTANWSSGSINISSTTSDTVDKWTHIVAQRSRANSRAQVWVNGVLEATSAATLSMGSSVRLSIGARNDNGTVNATWGGAFDDFRLYQRVLSVEDIQLLYAQGQRLASYVPRRRFYFQIGEIAGQPQTETVPVADATLTAVLPGVNLTVPVPVADLTTSAIVPGVNLTVPVPVADLTASAVLPATVVTYVATVPVADATLTAVLPAIASPYTMTVPVGDLAASAVLPGALATYSVTVPVATVDLTAEQPDIQLGSQALVTVPVATLVAEAVVPTTHVTMPVPVATAAASAVLPTLRITITVPVATCVCSAVYEIGGNHILDEVGQDTDDEDGFPLEDENEAAPNNIVVTVPVAICQCIAIPGQTVAGLETDLFADYVPIALTADRNATLTANYQTPAYTTWVRRVDTPSRGVQLK